MNFLMKIIYIIVATVGIVYVASTVFQFFGIGIDTYGIYLLFVVAIASLYIFLPSERGQLFSITNDKMTN